MIAKDCKACCHLQLLACIGEQFTEGEEICGVVVNVRAKQDRLCMWTKSASNEAAQVRTISKAPMSLSCAPFAAVANIRLPAPSLFIVLDRSAFSPDPPMQVSIGKQLKQVLDVDSSIRIGYLVHVRPLGCPKDALPRDDCHCCMVLPLSCLAEENRAWIYQICVLLILHIIAAISNLRCISKQ